MKHIILSLCLACLMAGTAQAGDAAAGAGAIAASDSDSAAQAGAAAGSTSSNALTINNPATPSSFRYENHTSGTTTVKSAPGITITGPASGPCTGLSGGFGVSFLGGAIGGNLATVDKGCQLRESSRILAMILPTLAGPEAEEVRGMLMESLRALYSQTVIAERNAK